MYPNDNPIEPAPLDYSETESRDALMHTSNPTAYAMPRWASDLLARIAAMPEAE